MVRVRGSRIHPLRGVMNKIVLTILIFSLTEFALLAKEPPASPEGAASSLANRGGVGPRYNVTGPTFGAMGDGKMDDTAAIQAAFSACGDQHTNPPVNTQQSSGVVEFEGGRDYIVSKTINTYNCQIEGTTGNMQGVGPQVKSGCGVWPTPSPL